MMEEYPDIFSGFCRTEARVMRLLSTGALSAVELFAKNQELEQKVFMGDWSFWQILNGLLGGDQPLVMHRTGSSAVTPRNCKQTLEITNIGQKVLQGECNRFDIYWPRRWYGGVKPGQDCIWCWNPNLKQPQQRAINERFR
jgi:hypothetical protein